MRLYHSLASVGIAGIAGAAIGHVVTEDASTATTAVVGGLSGVTATATYLTPPRGASMATAFWGGMAVMSGVNLLRGD